MAVPVAAIALGVVAAASLVSGAIKKGKANKMARESPPQYIPNEEDYDNLDLAEYMAQQGLTDSTRSNYTRNADRAMTSSIDAILKSGGSNNQVGDVYEAYLNNLSRLNVVDEQAKLQNIANLMQQRRIMSGEKDKAFQINQYAPWANRQAAAAQLASQGEQQIWQGISMAGSAVASAGNSMQQQNVNNSMDFSNFARGSGSQGFGAGAGSSVFADQAPYRAQASGSNSLYGVDISRLRPEDQQTFLQLVNRQQAWF